MEIENQNMKCKKHSQNDILYIQTNNFSDDQSIFYCELCPFTINNFSLKNCISLKQLLESNEDSIIFNYPPLDDNKIINQMIELQNQNSFINQIKLMNEYFDNLKSEIIKIIGEYQKKMNNFASEIPKINSNIIEKYQEISQLNELKTILKQNKTNLDEKEQQCKSFIQQKLKQKNANTKQLQQLLSQQNKLISLIQLERPYQIQCQILDTLELFSYLNVDINQIQNEKKDIDLLPNLDFTKYLFEQVYSNNLQVIKDQETNEFSFVSSQSNQWGSFYSNIILEKDKRYTFRLQAYPLEQKNMNYLVFGLVRDSTKDQNYCTKDYLSCSFCYSDNSFSLSQYARGLSKIILGNFKSLPQDTEIELLVSINEGILEVTDYPNKFHKIVLKREHQSNLTNHQNLRFFIGMENQIKIQLISANELKQI